MEAPPQNLGTGCVEVFDAELWTIGLALNETIKKRETLQRHGVKTVAVFSGSQVAIRRTVHLEPGPAQRVARRLNRSAQALLAHGIATEIHWVPGYSGITGNEEAGRQANLVREANGSTIIERPYTSALDRARHISDGRSAVKARWEADKCCKHFGY
jgi:ribonuclease HI